MRRIVFAMMAVFMMGAVAFAPRMAYAANEFTKKGCDIATTEEQKAALGCDVDAQAPSVVKNIINAVITVLGIVAVIVLIFAGQRYVTAQGDPGQLQQAKNMILYGVIGLLVASLAFAIVNFALSSVFAGE